MTSVSDARITWFNRSSEVSAARARFGASAVEDPPTDVVASSLVFKHQLADLGGQLGPLPCAFCAAIDSGPISNSSSPHGLDRVRGGTEIVLSNVWDTSRLTRGVGGEPGGTSEWSSGSHCMTAGSAALHHLDLMAYPSAHVIDGYPRPIVVGPDRLEQRQYVLRARSSPLGEEPMVIVSQLATMSDRDQPRITDLREDHVRLTDWRRHSPMDEWATGRHRIHMFRSRSRQLID